MLKKEPKAKSNGSAPGLIDSSSQSSCGSNEVVDRKKQSKPTYTIGTNVPATSAGVKTPFAKKLSSPSSSQRSSRRAAAPVAASSERTKQETFLDQTVQSLRDAFHSLQIWIAESISGSSHDDVSADKKQKQQQRTPSLNDIILAPCKGHSFYTKDQEKQEQDQFLFAEWKTNGRSENKEHRQQQQEQNKQQQRQAFSRIISLCAEETFTCQQKASDLVDQFMRLEQGESMDDKTLGDISIMNSEEEDEMQMRRLTSWGTIGTDGSIGTCESSASLATETERGASPCLDDDGNPINPVLLEKTIAASQKRHPKRKRVVKFDYPPVSSFRQCERLDQEDVDKLFFTEEELDQYEEDRYQTAVADDVEAVAIAPSSEEDREVLPNAAKTTGTPTRDANSNKFSSAYVPTPRIRDGVRKGRRPGTPVRNRIPCDNATSAASPTIERRSTPVGAEANKKQMSPAHRHHHHHHMHQQQQQQQQQLRGHRESISSPSSSVKTPKSPRLVKSVQIFLRERSTGNRTEEH